MSQMQQYGADNTPCGAHLFNLARGGIVVEEDAVACLEDGTPLRLQATPLRLHALRLHATPLRLHPLGYTP